MIESGVENVPLLAVEDLTVSFPLRSRLFQRRLGDVTVVEDVTFSINKGETFGLVGESGCGKTTTGKSILQIVDPAAGRILYKGVDLATMSTVGPRSHRRKIQLIFQDPYSSLDPRQSVFSILKEALEADRSKRTSLEVRSRVNELLDTVELGSAMGRRYPHEMSGGQRQRLGIARALACYPELIVCDEPVSALDVSIQAQIINLFKSIQRKTGIAYLFISHDLSVVRHVSKNIAVMYLGRLVEVTDSHTLYANPLHPYTKALLSAVPLTDYYQEQKRNRIVLSGEVPSPLNRPSGCPFHPRCTLASEECRVSVPQLRTIEANHTIACHNV